jgi:hypothetical protein
MNLILPASRPKASSSPTIVPIETPGPPVLPDHLWDLLTPDQRTLLFQSLVGLCRRLLTPNSQEENDDPR